jgi:pimeloyl-ACP methyl ester carboxylesterase
VAEREGEVRLSDGRRLAYAEYGDPNGRPVLHFHGFPNSRVNAAIGDEAARRAGVRLISFDRPGFGRSDHKKGRTIASWADDVVEAAGQLGIDRFAVIGYSGGGPYAAACAERIPQRLTAVALVSALAPLDVAAAVRGFPLITRLFIRLWRLWPWLTRPGIWLIGRQVRRDPEKAIVGAGRAAPPSDAAVLSRPEVRAAYARDLTESFRQGSRAAADEFRLYLKHWNISEERITIEVRLWQGEADKVVPPSMGRYHAQVIPNCRAVFLPEQGHYWLVDHYDEILAALAAAR